MDKNVSLLVQQSAQLFVLRCGLDKEVRINVMLITHRASDIPQLTRPPYTLRHTPSFSAAGSRRDREYVRVTIVIKTCALRHAFALRGQRVGCMLQHKLVVTFQHALGMFSREHSAIFRRTLLQT